MVICTAKCNDKSLFFGDVMLKCTEILNIRVKNSLEISLVDSEDLNLSIFFIEGAKISGGLVVKTFNQGPFKVPPQQGLRHFSCSCNASRNVQK